METDVLIIGAGPAGLQAALEPASRGLDVIVLDESINRGGQLLQQTQFIHTLPSSYKPMRGFELAYELINQLEDYPIRYLLGHRVIGLYKDGSVGVTDEKSVYAIKAKKIIVSTGAAEKAVPFPKWTLPGIMTIGAAQTLINRDRVLPGKNAIIVGSSDFALDVALQLSEVGVTVKGIIEKHSSTLAKDIEKKERVEKREIPIFLNSYIKEARGVGEIEEIDIQQGDHLSTEKVDLVCVDGGRTPILDPFYQLGCAFGYQEELGGWLPQYNRQFQTSCEDVFVAGNAAGISHQGAIILTGSLAGIGVCEALGAVSQEEAEVSREQLWKELEIVETKLYEDAWKARVQHVKNFSNPVIKDQFIS